MMSDVLSNNVFVVLYSFNSCNLGKNEWVPDTAARSAEAGAHSHPSSQLAPSPSASQPPPLCCRSAKASARTFELIIFALSDTALILPLCPHSTSTCLLLVQCTIVSLLTLLPCRFVLTRKHAVLPQTSIPSSTDQISLHTDYTDYKIKKH